MYSAAAGTSFGFKTQFTDAVKDALHHGQYCSTGYAYMSAANTATCFTLVKIGFDATANISTPYQCTPTDTTKMCKYYYDATNSLTTNCQCGLDGNGYCPYPGVAEMTSYIQYMKAMRTGSSCHTLDRLNMRAQQECGIGNNADWRNAIKVQFKYKYWPFL